MDAVELVIRFEEAFGIAIPDEVAERLTTPREVTDYLAAQIVVGDQPSCLSQQAFYFLRTRLVSAQSVPLRNLGPSTRLEAVIPIVNRRHVWESLKSQLGPAAIPDLVRAVWLFRLLSLVTILAFIYTIISARNTADVSWSVVFLAGLIVAFVVGYGGAVLTRPFRRHFPDRYATAGDLAKYLVVHSPHAFKREKRQWTREQIADVVRAVIVDQLGREDFTEDSHFINDMHID